MLYSVVYPLPLKKLKQKIHIKAYFDPGGFKILPKMHWIVLWWCSLVPEQGFLLLHAGPWACSTVGWVAVPRGDPLNSNCLKTYSMWFIVVLLVPVQQSGCLSILKPSEPWMKVQSVRGGAGWLQVNSKDTRRWPDSWAQPAFISDE